MSDALAFLAVGSGARSPLADTPGDCSLMGKFELHGCFDELGTATWRDGAWWCPVTPSRALVLGERPPVEDCLDLTSSLAALRLPRHVFSSFCALDLRPQAMPIGGFRPGSVARTPGYVLREAEDSYLMLFGAAYAQYMSTVVANA